MNHPIPMKGGYEYDAFSGWRRFIFQRAKTRAWVKRRYWHRARAEARKGVVAELMSMDEFWREGERGADA